MQNIITEIKGNILTLTIDLSKEIGESKTGKSINIATTNGATVVEGFPGVKLGLNCYKSKS